MSDFDNWWDAYPHKVGKLAAQRAYATARKQATAAALLAGIGPYKRSKPAYADWCHPRTWLSQGRWMDAVEQRGSGSSCPHTPACERLSACITLTLQQAKAAREA